jgi:hypothetical protein
LNKKEIMTAQSPGGSRLNYDPSESRLGSTKSSSFHFVSLRRTNKNTGTSARCRRAIFQAEEKKSRSKSDIKEQLIKAIEKPAR